MGCFNGGNQRMPGTGSHEAAAQIAMRNENLWMLSRRGVDERHCVHNLDSNLVKVWCKHNVGQNQSWLKRKVALLRNMRRL